MGETPAAHNRSNADCLEVSYRPSRQSHPGVMGCTRQLKELQ